MINDNDKKLIDEVKTFLINNNKMNNEISDFSDAVIKKAHSKLTENFSKEIENEDEVAILMDLTQSYITLTKLISEKDLAKQQHALKLFEQLTKYNQNKYY